MNYNIVKTHKLLDQRMAIIVRDTEEMRLFKTELHKTGNRGSPRHMNIFKL